MKTIAIALASAALTTGFVAAVPAQAEMAAGPFDKLKKKVKKAKDAVETAEQAVETVDTVRRSDARTIGNGVVGAVTGGRAAAVNQAMRQRSNYPQTAKAPDHAGVAGPIPAKYAGATTCADVGVGNAFVARDGNYTFQQGISTEERGGLIDRRPIEPSQGCVFEGLGIGDVLYVEFDKGRYDRHDYKIQCVSYDGSEQQDNVFGPKTTNFAGKDIMLHTGNSVGYEPTATGSNSDRSGAYDAYMDARGRAFTIFNFEPRHDDKAGTDFYCQWFNSDTGESAIALTYRRGPAPR